MTSATKSSNISLQCETVPTRVSAKNRQMLGQQPLYQDIHASKFSQAYVSLPIYSYTQQYPFMSTHAAVTTVAPSAPLELHQIPIVRGLDAYAYRLV